MDLRAVRHDIGVVAQTANFNTWDYQPDDPKDLPAAVVGGIKAMQRLNAAVTLVQIGVTFFVNASDPQDAAQRLDLALSTIDGSFCSALDAYVETPNPHAWRSAKFLSAGPYLRYTMPGGGVALGCEMLLELTA